MRRSRKVALAALLLASCLAGLPAATDPLVSVKVEADTLVAGQRFTIAIRLHDNGLATPVAALPALDPRVSILSGPEISTETSVDASGRQGRFVFMRYTARANTPGYAELPPISVHYGVQSLQTEALLLQIRRDDGGAEVPPDLVWRVHADRVYRGQPVLVTLDLIHSPTIVFPDSVEIPSLPGGSSEKVAGIGRIETDRLANQDFQSLPVASFLYTPSTAGTVSLPLSRAIIGKMVISSQPMPLAVLDLPPDAVGLTAIGDLKLSAALDSQAIGREESARLSLRVEGTGNLRTLQMPEPVFLGLQVVSKSENGKQVPTEQGYRGYRETVYQLKSDTPGVYSVAIPPFPVLAANGRLSPGEPRNLSLEVMTVSKVRKEETGAATPRFMSLADIAAMGADPAAGGWGAMVESGLAAAEAGDYAGAAAWFTKALTVAPDQPGLWYDLGLASHGRGMDALALSQLQAALRLRPWDGRIRQAMSGLEGARGLERQLPVAWLPPWVLLTALGAAGLVLAAASALVFLRRRRLRWLGSALVLLLVAALAGGTLLYGFQQRNLPVAVVAETGTVLKRIPEQRARDWLRLPSGTTVRVAATHQGWLLVETAFGGKGWVERSAVYLAEDRTAL